MPVLLIILFLVMAFSAHAGILPKNLLSEEDLDLFCLRLSYPQIAEISRSRSGGAEIRLRNGYKLTYANSGFDNESLNTDIKTSMATHYPLEPERPIPGAGVAPGRKRPYELLFALYGQNPANIQANLIGTPFNGANLRLAKQAANAFKRARSDLDTFASQNEYKKYLVPDGAYYWRKIAGESWLSAHSFGIAIDLGAKHAPYWRWSKKMPHPLQQSYPVEIVESLEKHGFIWGGKWHEYDLMHFEYRPEILCKSRMINYMKP